MAKDQTAAPKIEFEWGGEKIVYDKENPEETEKEIRLDEFNMRRLPVIITPAVCPVRTCNFDACDQPDGTHWDYFDLDTQDKRSVDKIMKDHAKTHTPQRRRVFKRNERLETSWPPDPKWDADAAFRRSKVETDTPNDGKANWVD